jgi:hypothetical protein
VRFFFIMSTMNDGSVAMVSCMGRVQGILWNSPTLSAAKNSLQQTHAARKLLSKHACMMCEVLSAAKNSLQHTRAARTLMSKHAFMRCDVDVLSYGASSSRQWCWKRQQHTECCGSQQHKKGRRWPKDAAEQAPLQGKHG